MHIFLMLFFLSLPTRSSINLNLPIPIAFRAPFLTLLDYEESSQQQGSILELSPVDFTHYKKPTSRCKQHSSSQRSKVETPTMTVKIRVLGFISLKGVKLNM